MIITIDRIEGNFAVCEIDQDKFANLPLDFLPKGAKEGSKLRIEIDSDTEKKERERIRGKMDNLFKK